MRKIVPSFILLLLIFGCSKELETEDFSNEEQQNDNHIELLYKHEISDIDLKFNVTKNLSTLKILFPAESNNSIIKSESYYSRNLNDTAFQKIEINTDVFAEVRNEKGIPSYTFEVELPDTTTSSKGKFNLHTYYDENNQLKSNLIRYDLTPDEFVMAIKNKSYDGFWDKIFFMELSDVDETEDLEEKKSDNDSIQNINKLSTKSLASARKCSCQNGGTTAPKWTPLPTGKGYPGSTASGIGYVLPPLNTLPYHVTASLKAAGVFTGSYTIDIGTGHSSPVNHTQLVLTFSVQDIRIPRNTTGSSYVPFQYFYPYKMAELKNTISEYYKKVYVSQINSYINSEKTSIVDHAKKQSYITQFFYFMHKLKAQKPASFEYLQENPSILRSMFYFLEEDNEIHNNFTTRKDFAEAAIEALENGGEVDFEEFYISTETPDDNYVYQGPKQKIPSVLVLSNGTKVGVTFISHTTDKISSNQPVAIELINGLKFALEKANSNLPPGDKINAINIYATTNGIHGDNSNHYKSQAVDINSINGKRMFITGLTNQIKELQKALDNFKYVRENYGPYFKHKYYIAKDIWDLNKKGVGDHSTHIHFAIRKD